MRTFRNDYAVLVCDHVFRRTAITMFVVRDLDGFWQFLCGDESCVESAPCHSVGVGHLLSQDPSLSMAAALEPGQYYERSAPEEPWVRGVLGNEV